MNNLEKMTHKSQEAFQAAVLIAQKHGNPAVEPEHLLYEVIEPREGIVAQVLARSGVKRELVLDGLKRLVDQLPQVSGDAAKLGMSQGLLKLMNQAESTAQSLGDTYVSVEHFLN